MRKIILAAAVASAALALPACSAKEAVAEYESVNAEDSYESVTGELVTEEQARFISDFNSMDSEDKNARFDELLARNEG